MRREWMGFAAFLVSTCLVSCSQAPDQPEQGPQQTVFDFLEAVRVGDDVTAEKLLTSVAREKTSALDMQVKPPGSDTAEFEVGHVETLDGSNGRVQTTWTDVAPDGNQRSDEIVWRVRIEEGEWRISGMEAKLFPDLDAMIMNFEDPEEMIKQQKIAEKEIMRRLGNNESQTAEKKDPFQPARR